MKTVLRSWADDRDLTQGRDNTDGSIPNCDRAATVRSSNQVIVRSAATCVKRTAVRTANCCTYCVHGYGVRASPHELAQIGAPDC